MRKKSREMDAAWALEVMDKAPYITVSMTDMNERLCRSAPNSIVDRRYHNICL